VTWIDGTGYVVTPLDGVNRNQDAKIAGAARPQRRLALNDVWLHHLGVNAIEELGDNRIVHVTARE
jgi:hypothetical protein